MDGYEESFKIKEEVDKFKFYSDNQDRLNLKLQELVKEANELPNFPGSVEDWVDSWSNLDSKKNFSINSVKKHYRIQKEYDKIVEQSDANIRQMKIISIENLIEKINKILEK